MRCLYFPCFSVKRRTVNQTRKVPEENKPVSPESAEFQSHEEEPEPHQWLNKPTKSLSFSSVLEKVTTSLTHQSDSSSTVSLSRSNTVRSTIRRLTNESLAPISRLSSKDMNSPNSKRKANPAAILRKRMDEIRFPQGNRSSQFIPHTALKHLFQEKDVIDALQSHKFTVDIHDLAKFICEKAQKIFAILIWRFNENRIEQFYNSRLGDDRLPIHVNTQDDEEIQAFTDRFGQLHMIPNHPFNEHPWNVYELDGICRQDQWPFLSPIFHPGKFRYDLHPATIMPFVDSHYLSQKESFFSVVQEWHIHRDHLQTPDLMETSIDGRSHPRIAVKILKRTSMSEEEFLDFAKAEVDNLDMIRSLNHPHLIKAIAYYIRDREHCIIFPWANRGNLRDLWKVDPPALTPSFVKWVFSQMCGLASAMARLHHSHSERSTRHGDLKPENVLCFCKASDSGKIEYHGCTLVIADVGLSKSHDIATEKRKEATRTKSGTIMYEPPETELQTKEPRSRRYDVWSLGCIYLEFVVWLLYGVDELNRFRDEISGFGSNSRFYVVEKKPGVNKSTSRLNPAAQKWVEWILKNPRCPEGTAVHSLVQLIVNRLLVEDVPVKSRVASLRKAETFGPSNPSLQVRSATLTSNAGLTLPPSGGYRATAGELKDELENITYTKSDWMKWDAPVQNGPGQYGNHLNPLDKSHVKDQESEYRFTPLNDKWKYTPDLDIAQNIFNGLNYPSTHPQFNATPSLCDRCRDLRLWHPRCSFSDRIGAMKMRSSSCQLCRLLLECLDPEAPGDDESIRFLRVGSSLVSNDRQNSPIASLYIFPSTDRLDAGQYMSTFQVGFPRLPEAGDPMHITMLAEWISSCDITHTCQPTNGHFRPSRVLDIGDAEGSLIRLRCDLKDNEMPLQYIALSHKWGSPSQHRIVCTDRKTLELHMQGLTIEQLPKTFRDAIHITRCLNIQYLWIDSLCIIQDDATDWEEESKLMEQVFSSAYVTIAASCANGTDDGFLKPRLAREGVAMRGSDGSQYYVCKSIDNFDADVNQGQLNRRGWVLQERALSCRTIHFTETQTYWECGEGVRCETMTKMNNKRASFLGDSNFPYSILTYVKGMKIQLFQGLYELYSKLELSFQKDRPIAIRGLEKRLLSAFNTAGGFGIFNCYLHRCLLWQRSGSGLARISSFSSEVPPSWSWMSYHGGIKYMSIPFGKVDWTKNIISPFDSRELKTSEILQGGEPFEIVAQAWKVIDPRPHHLTLDQPDNAYTAMLECVIIGSERQRSEDQITLHYVLLVQPVEGDIYERVGVGTLEANQIEVTASAATVRIR